MNGRLYHKISTKSKYPSQFQDERIFNYCLGAVNCPLLAIYGKTFDDDDSREEAARLRDGELQMLQPSGVC